MRVYITYSCLIFVATMAAEFQMLRSRMAVDYGPRLIGLAISLGGDARPLTTISNNGNLSLISREVLNVCKCHSVSELLIGIPLDSRGKLGGPVRNFNGQLCLNFSQVITSIAFNEFPRTKVFLCDERYTTKEAKMRMKMEGIRASLDAMSACCLLQRYVEDRGEDAVPATPSDYPPPRELEVFDYNVVKEYIRDAYYSDDVRVRETGPMRMKRLKSSDGESRDRSRRKSS